MDNTKSIKQYDLFKLIVTIVLLLTFLCLLLFASKRDSAPSSYAPPLSTLTSDSVPQTSLASPTPMLTETQQPISTDVPMEIPSSTAAATSTSIPTPSADSSNDELITDISTCEEISKSQLQVGMTAKINQRLNFRSSPEIKSNRILTHRPESQVKVIGGPVCTRYLNGGAYLWWQLELPNGLVGWSAEASIFGDYYFMEPGK